MITIIYLAAIRVEIEMSQWFSVGVMFERILFAWCICYVLLFVCFQVKGETLEQFMEDAQDRSRNAREKSLQAGFEAWKEQLRADQMSFQSNQIMIRG